MPWFPGVAQMVARLNGVQEAAGSTPVTRTKKLWEHQLSELFYLLRLIEPSASWNYNNGRWFNSSHSDHLKTTISKASVRPLSHFIWSWPNASTCSIVPLAPASTGEYGSSILINSTRVPTGYISLIFFASLCRYAISFISISPSGIIATNNLSQTINLKFTYTGITMYLSKIMAGWWLPQGHERADGVFLHHEERPRWRRG